MADADVAREIERDVAAREAALDASRSILLQAPAGSGKTEVLTQRFLRLLAVVDEPEEILAVTFTRKAAAEMRRRIVRVLEGDIDPERPTARTLAALRAAALARAAERGWNPLELRTRLRIQTIDSLNHELARAMPLLGGGPSGLTVAEDAKPLYREAARLTLHHAEREPSLQASMDEIFTRLDNNWSQAERLLADMLASRAQWLPVVFSASPDALADVVERSLESLVTSALQSLVAQCPSGSLAVAAGLLQRAARWREAAGQPATKAGEPAVWAAWLEPHAALTADPRQLPAWRALADFLLNSRDEWRTRYTIAEGGIPTAKVDATAPDAKAAALALCADCESVAGLRESLALVRVLPPPALGAAERTALGALARLLKLAASELDVCFEQAGRVDHTKVAAVARQGLRALGLPSELALRRAAALKHLLLDEFQDTSVEQCSLVEALIVGWQDDEGRSAFIVGDPMQSIYQFRSAEVSLFLRAREHGIGDLSLEPLALTRNFRSAPALIRWSNRGFASIFPPRDDLRESAVRFLPATAGREVAGDPHPAVSMHRLASDVPEAEAKLLADAVLAARRRRPDASVAVLVQAATHAPAIIEALRAAGLPVRGVDLEPLARQPAVRDVVELGCALLHPGDRVAWLATLHAPWCGLTLADLLLLTQGSPDAIVPDLLNDAGRVATLSDDGRRRLARCTPLLLKALDAQGREPFVPALRALWEALGGSAALRSDAEWELVQSYLDALADRVDDAPLITGATLRDLAESLKLGGDAVRPDSVEVLTIHKAKGLEWDVVLLPGLHRQLRGDERPLLSWIELPRPDRSVDLLMASLSIGHARRDDRLGSYIALLRRQRQKHERCRLAYVAATRAREELHLFAYAEEVDGVLKPRTNSMLRTFWPAIETQMGEAAPAGGEQSPTPEPAEHVESMEATVADSVRLPVDWLPAPRPALRIERVDGGIEPGESESPEYLWAGTRRRAIGTVVHAELERLAAVAPGAPLPSRANAWRSRLRELGVEAPELDAAITDVERILSLVHRDPQARWILSPDHREAASELRLSGFAGGRLRDVVVDRTFVTHEGERWVIDYKTGTHQGGDLEGFLAEELVRYRDQLEMYRELVSELGPEPVRTALYFPLLQRLVELPAVR